MILARVVAVGCPYENCGSWRTREERDSTNVVELSASSLELERAQPRVLVFLNVVASDDPVQERVVHEMGEKLCFETFCSSHQIGLSDLRMDI